MLASVNIFYSILTFLFMASLYLACKFILRPTYLLQYYKKQGVEVIYFRLFGNIKQFEIDMLKHNDCFYSIKQKGYQNPESLVCASGFKDQVLVRLFDPRLIKDFLLTQDRYCRKLLPSVTFMNQLAGKGLIFSEGADWKKHRKLASNAFNYEFLKEMIPEVISIIDESLNNLKGKDLEKVNIVHEMKLITGEVVGRVFFGENFSKYKIQGQPLVTCLMKLLSTASITDFEPLVILLPKWITKIGLMSAHRKLLKDIKEFKAIIKDIAIQKRLEIEKSVKLATNKRINLVELFYKQRGQTPEEALSDEEIIDEFITFFWAGMDTTAHVVRMASYYFLLNPQYQNKLLEEVNRYFSNPSEVTLDKLNTMEYMTAWIKESLRMTPVGASLFLRETIKDCQLGWLSVKKGTIISTPVLSNYYDPKYHQQPEKFMPERWLDNNSETKKNVNENPFIYVPFSAGPRNCLGQHLAMNEARVLFSLFLKKFDFTLADKDYKLIMTERSVYEPLHPLIYKLKVQE